jgi:diaminopimelate epimerase
MPAGSTDAFTLGDQTATTGGKGVGLRFAKYEGLGNDFLVVDVDLQGPLDLTARQAATLCDRHVGVGADGVLVTGIASGRPFMRVYNADGSRPEMCGNGLRCVALYLVHAGRLSERELEIDTEAGAHWCRVLDAGSEGQVRSQMRAPSFAPEDVPVRSSEALIDAFFDIDGDRLRVTALSVGNPHAVTFDHVGARRAELGPKIAIDPRFPDGVNVGFASLQRDPDARPAIELHVHERGSGWTRACGTGACAAAAAAVRTGRVEAARPVAVRLPGGPLQIEAGHEGEPIYMTGPARHVFDGVLTPATLGGSS